MKEPDSRPASRLRFSKDEMPDEMAETKPRRKVRWQLDTPVEATQKSVSHSSVSQAEDGSSPRVNDAQALGSEITTESDMPAEYRNDPLPRGNATPHKSGEASTRPLFTRTKKRPGSRSDEPQPRKATLSFEENAPKQPSKMTHQPQHRVSALVSDSLHRETQTSNEDGNVGVTATDQGIAAVEGIAHSMENAHHSHQLRKHRKSVQAASAPGSAHSSGFTSLQTERAASSCTAHPPVQPLAIQLQVVCIPFRGITDIMHQLLAVIPCPKLTRSGQSGRGTSLQEAERLQAEPTRRRRAQRQQPKKRPPPSKGWERCSSARKAALCWCCWLPCSPS